MAKQPYTNIYDFEYYDASQTFLYIGDVWVDEVVALKYDTIQQKRPLYGYASQLFDDVAAGQVIVQGSFAINFKEQGYLWAVLRRYKEIYFDAAGVELENIKDEQLKNNLTEYERRLLAGKSNNPSQVVGPNGVVIDKQVIEKIVTGDISVQERYNIYQEIAGYSIFTSREPRSKEFKDIQAAFENEVWSSNSNNELNSQIRRTDHNIFDGFDMYVVFGNFANPNANHTVQKIIKVCLTSQGKQIQVGGGVILEEYGFFAQTTA